MSKKIHTPVEDGAEYIVHDSLESKYKPGDKVILGMVLGVLTYWLFAQSMFNVVPDVMRSIDIPMASLNLALSLTALFSGCFIVVAGGLADRFGRMKFTYLGFVLSIIGSFLLILAQNTEMMIIGRIIQGLSGACIMPATLALVKTYYDGADRQRALSFWSIGSFGGSSLCSLVGGAIATYLGWRWIFVFSIICALLGMLLIKGVPESKVESTNQRTRFDTEGLILFVIALISLNLVITKGTSWGWTSPVILILTLLCVISTFIFFKIEFRKKSTAFIDFSLFKNMPFSGATCSNFLINAITGVLIVANTYLQTGRGFTPFQTGLLSVGNMIALLSMIRVGEKILQKVGAKKPMFLGPTIAGFGVLLVSFTFLPGKLYIICVMLGYILLGIGIGFYATPATDTAISNAPADKAGTASGIFKMASSLGGAFGLAISASIFTALQASGISIASAATAGLIASLSFCILSAITVIWLVPANAGKSNT